MVFVLYLGLFIVRSCDEILMIDRSFDPSSDRTIGKNSINDSSEQYSEHLKMKLYYEIVLFWGISYLFFY
jgi:hypothetical protein